jgi:cyanate lyase
MSYERAIATRKEEIAIMKKRLKQAATEEEKKEIQRRIKLVEDAIKQLQISAKVREQIEEVMK